ncbi:MAG: recombination protein O N-terminal domain-containing protein [Bacteroidetes bacterium]|nr:recombination protein O N-terminal domain-containing protein [Bacteroidota bacterium]
MLSKTKGIVIKSVKYGDNSAIVNIFTHEFGLLGFYFPKIYANKGYIKPSHIQALNVLELTFNYSSSKNLFNVKELNFLYHFNNQSFHQKALYNIITEILNQTLKTNEQNAALFNYLYDYQIPLLNDKGHFWQLPQIMIYILHYFGCAPNCESYTENYVLDLQNGVFIQNSDSKNTYKAIANKEISSLIFHILNKDLELLPSIVLLRHDVIEALIAYFKYHVNENFTLKSREILFEVLNK